MKGAGLLARRDLRDLSRGLVFKIVSAALLLAALAMAYGAGALAFLLGEAPQTVTAQVPAQIGTILYFATLFPFLTYLWAFSGAGLVKEKATGHLETLLATPLAPDALWAAKSVELVLPGLAMATLASLFVATALWLIPRCGGFTGPGLPPALLVLCWLGNPLLLAGLAGLTVVIALRASPEAALVPSFGLGFFLMAAYPAGSAVGIVDPGSWTFTAGYLAAGGLEWALVLCLVRGLSKEKIVTSARSE